MLELNKIHQGDCLERLKEVDNNSIDLVVIDPPYFQVMKRDWKGEKHEWDNQWKDIEDYQIEITAEKRSKWWSLNCVSLTRDEIMKDLKDVEQNLVRLFNNV